MTVTILPAAAETDNVMDVASLYERMRHEPPGEDFEILYGQFQRRCNEDPEAVKRAIEENAFRFTRA